APKFTASYGMLGTTFGGNHLACAAAVAVLDVMESENLLHNAKEVGDYLIAVLRSCDKVREVRGRGWMIGIDLPEELANVQKDLSLHNRILTGEAKPNVMRLLPALNIPKELAARSLSALEARLRA